MNCFAGYSAGAPGQQRPNMPQQSASAQPGAPQPMPNQGVPGQPTFNQQQSSIPYQYGGQNQAQPGMPQSQQQNPGQQGMPQGSNPQVQQAPWNQPPVRQTFIKQFDFNRLPVSLKNVITILTSSQFH